MKNKGKAKGRAGQKERSKKAGTPKGTPKSKPWLSLLEDDENPHKLFRGFAGANSPHSFSPRDLNVRLRNVPISFVSAGTNTPAESDPEPSSRDVKHATEEEDEDDDDVIDLDEEFDDEGLQTNIVMESEELEVPQGAMAHMHITAEGDNGRSDTDMTYVEVRRTAQQASTTQQLPKPEQQSAAPESLSFIIDTEGDPTLDNGMYTTMKNKKARSPSPAPSSSSEEEVVFHGRNKPRVINDPVARPATKSESKPRSQPHVTDDLLAALQKPTPSKTMTKQRAPMGWAAAPATASKNEDEPWTPAPAEPFWRKPKARPDLSPSKAELEALENSPARKSKVMFQEGVSEAPSAEQTIASLQADWKTKQQEKQAKASSNKEKIPLEKTTQSRRNKRGRKKGNRQLRAEPLSIDDDDDSEAAYDDYMANLMAQLDGEDDTSLEALASLARSELISGPSLVVDGKEVDDDELLDSNLEIDDEDDSSSDDDIIGQDLDDISDDDGPFNYSDLDSSDLEDELEYDEQEQWEDEEDLRQRRIERMTDEQVARLFAKQVEMGIDSDELILDDGFYASDDDLDGIGDLDEARAGLDQLLDSSFGRVTKKTAKGKRGAKGNDSFPDASMLADTIEQYGENGFDIMDLDRPSLRTTKKGRKGKLPPELEALSDEDLKAEMRDQWEGDRSKKRLRKAEREELRAQGLLGSMAKKGKADLSEKYLEGMNMKQLRDELRIFLMNDGQQSRPFPPMDKEDRKALHEIANAFNLKSKSVGSGKNRFPVLYKTKRTADFSDARFNRVMLASSRGFLSNNNGRPNKFKKGKAGTGGGFNAAAVSLRHGEEVGAGAPEIGKENFGHRLMEKMGWTKGTALGKDGEGMLLPVSQVMRSGKAGLG